MVVVSLSLRLSLFAVVVSFRGVVVASVVVVAVVSFVAVGVPSVEGVVGDHGAWFDPTVIVVLF